MVTSPFFRIQQVADGVFAALAKPGTGAGANAGIVDLGRSALVVDAMFTPEAGAALRDAAEHLTGGAVRWLVLTAADHDHVLGAQAFPRAAVIATPRTASNVLRRAPRFVRAARRDGARWLEELGAAACAQPDPVERSAREAMRQDLLALLRSRNLRPVCPSLTFGSRLTIYGQSRHAEILSFGGVHGEGDAVLYLPQERVLFCGDIVPVGRHPAVRAGGPDVWATVAGRIADLPADVVVGGHGPVGAREDLLLAERYYWELPDWALGTPVPEPFASWDGQHSLLENLRYAQGVVER